MSTGGKYSLTSAILESHRRQSSEIEVSLLAKFIFERSKDSPDGLVTYKEIWEFFFPNKPWSGNHPRTVISNALYKVIFLCVSNSWPMITTVVVQTQSRKLSDDAKMNIFNEAKELGIDVGLNVDQFIAQQLELTKTFLIKNST